MSVRKIKELIDFDHAYELDPSMKYLFVIESSRHVIEENIHRLQLELNKRGIKAVVIYGVDVKIFEME